MSLNSLNSVKSIISMCRPFCSSTSMNEYFAMIVFTVNWAKNYFSDHITFTGVTTCGYSSEVGLLLENEPWLGEGRK